MVFEWMEQRMEGWIDGRINELKMGEWMNSKWVKTQVKW